MILDTQTMFSDDQAITVTAVSTNIVDLASDSSKVQALNEKGDLQMFVQVSGAAFAGGTSLKVDVYTSDSSTMNGQAIMVSSAAIVTASLVLGYQFPLGKLDRINVQYMRLTYTVVGTMSAGNITAGLIIDKQTYGPN